MGTEVFMLFKKLKTKDILWLLYEAKKDNFIEWLARQLFLLHKWGKKGRK